MVSKGLGWYLEKAQNLLNGGRFRAEPERESFLKGAIISYRGIMNFIHRYADEAEALSKETQNSEEISRLTEISTLCKLMVSGHDNTFREALELIWFVTFASQKVAGCGVFCFSRMDQYLLPYYEKDLASGIDWGTYPSSRTYMLGINLSF